MANPGNNQQGTPPTTIHPPNPAQQTLRLPAPAVVTPGFAAALDTAGFYDAAEAARQHLGFTVEYDLGAFVQSSITDASLGSAA